MCLFQYYKSIGDVGLEIFYVDCGVDCGALITAVGRLVAVLPVRLRLDCNIPILHTAADYT